MVIILFNCEEIRKSEYSSFNDEELGVIIYTISRNTITNQLPGAAMQYDSTQFSNYNVKYNNKALDQVLAEIN